MSNLQLKPLLLLLATLPYFGKVAAMPADGTADQKAQATARQTTDNAELCKDLEQATDCKAIERIKVEGQRLLPISYTADGYYQLDREKLQAYSFGNGNLNDLLGLLPGVQYGETAYAANQVANIRPPEVSIAGAEGYQSGYFIDGVSNNSKLSQGGGQTDRNLIQDVSGHSQQTFINVKLLDRVTVYDSNVPARYGDFSGGLVLAETRNAEDKLGFGLSYRYTGDQLLNYHRFYAADFDGGMTLDEATFSKQDMSAYLELPFNDKSGLMVQMQRMYSEESFDQLGVIRTQQQTNDNLLLKYHYQLTSNDLLAIRYLYAPYQGEYFDVTARRSDYQIDGGGQSLLMQWQANRSWAQIDSQLSLNHSENSKRAPNTWYTWRNIKGRNWGDYNGSLSSTEGGYGDIDKTQTDISWRQDLVLTDERWGATNHVLNFGYSLTHQESVFDRLEDAILYNGAVIDVNLDCGGYALDCVETRFKQPIAELEKALGRPLDLSNPEDFQLYQDNILVAGQYFQSRQISPKSRAEARINSAAFYVEDEINWYDVDIGLGLRYDFNDFFKNHNLAPRMRISYEFAQGYQLIGGANRYYASDLSSYKLNQAMQPFLNQVRSAYQQQPRQWQQAVVAKGYSYRYDNTRTPYSDELTLAYRQPLLGGVAELRWLQRKSRDTITRQRGYNDLGEPIVYGVNDGESDYERVTLSWLANFGQQHVEFNISHASNTTSADNFDGNTINGGALNYSYDDSELIFLRKQAANKNGELENNYYLITRHDLSLEKQDANRPIIANLSWGWRAENWRVSAYARYTGSQEAVYPTGEQRSHKDAVSVCEGCQPNQREYPVYRLADRPAYWLLDASFSYQLPVTDELELTLSVDAQNLLNKRTYQISPYTTGLELGRQLWLGISLDY